MVDNAPLLPDFDADYRATHEGWPWLSVEGCEILAPFVESHLPKILAMIESDLARYEQSAVVDGDQAELGEEGKL